MTDPQIPDKILAALKARHDAPQRHYHSWTHIAALLDWLEKVRPKIADPLAVELAILYHDAVYEPRSKANEADSAVLMRAELSGVFPARTLDRVETLILATAGHLLPETSDRELLSDCAFFLDMDLSILGAPPAVFQAYEDAIRREYAFVPSEEYRKGRGRVLGDFLARERLYFTEDFHDRLETQARANLAWSLKRLAGA